MKKNVLYYLLCLMVVVGIIVLVVLNKEVNFKVDDISYKLDIKLSSFLDEWKIDYDASNLKKDSLLKSNSEDDLRIYLKNDKYKSGASVVVENNTNKDLDYKDTTVTEFIFECENECPSIIINKKIPWNINKQETKEKIGKPEIEEEDYFGYRLDKESYRYNVYFNELDQLKRIVIFA